MTTANTPVRKYTFHNSHRMQQRLHEIIPGGAHTYARGSDQYPEGMAPVIARGKGCKVWDVDDNCFIEYGMGLRSVTLGHAYQPVVDAVRSELENGISFSRPTKLELTAAEDFLNLIPGADMVKFAKNGSDATTAAVRLARAATGRNIVAICDQPFYSVDDWFIGSTPMDFGIPQSTKDLVVKFRFNDIGSLESLVSTYSGQIACVVMEAATAHAEPKPGFRQAVRDLCDKNGIVLVFDEMITGFRWSAHGAQGVYGIRPDLSCWGKAMGNGFPISALAGRRELMELGGLRTDSRRVFLLSTTHGPETASLAAFRAVVKAYVKEDPVSIMEERGRLLAAGINAVAKELGISDNFHVTGRPSCLVFATKDANGLPSQAYRTLMLKELLNGGILGQSFVVSAAHTVEDIEYTINMTRAALVTYRDALNEGSVDRVLSGRPVAPALRTYAKPRQER